MTYGEGKVRIISVKRNSERWNGVKAEAFDQKFDEGQEDIINDLDLSKLRRPGYEQQRVAVDFPIWMIEALDREALRLGISRQSIIKV